MIPLNFDILDHSVEKRDSILIKITEFKEFKARSGKDFGIIVRGLVENDLSHYGFSLYFDEETYQKSDHSSKILFPLEAQYLSEGDVIKISLEDRRARVLFRKKANTNSFLITENCNSFCLMCSQPPKKRDDSFILKEILETIPLIPKNCPEVGFTGGEPFLKGTGFLEILKEVNNQLPHTSVHILSNGRLMKDIKLAHKVAEIGLKDLMIGIPLYSDISYRHDFIVQSKGAFSETIKGILNLKKVGIKVEIRFVIHKETANDIISFSHFISDNLPFVDHIAFMGLEDMGFAKFNYDQLWIDPIDYMKDLQTAVVGLGRQGLNVSIYNHQLCLIPFELLPYYRKSISDWKNDYLDVCRECSKANHCGGFFSSTIKPSKALRAI